MEVETLLHHLVDEEDHRVEGSVERLSQSFAALPVARVAGGARRRTLSPEAPTHSVLRARIVSSFEARRAGTRAAVRAARLSTAIVASRMAGE